ncbi:hypothetical protein BH11ARM1_BH11ARM1_08420 [soil metagenome]
MLKIIVNSGNNVAVDKAQVESISTTVRERLGRFEDRLTQVEAYIADENAAKEGGNDKRCMLEARPNGMDPLHVTVHADTVDQAVHSATHKLERMLDDSFSRLETIHGR